jgi:DNA adenine methylase
MADNKNQTATCEESCGRNGEQPSQSEFHFENGVGVIPLNALPFLKWAGGKSQLLQKLEPFFPTRFDRYVEPFVGGGAVFFHLRSRFPKAAVLLCDNNDELINCYTIVRDEASPLMELLDRHLQRFLRNRKDYYYDVRSQHKLQDPLSRAARMIFLNRTCFNGLWRVNASGEFNVPMGHYTKVKLYDRGNLLAASKALSGVELLVQDFRKTFAKLRADDFVYVDPPYHPASRTAHFTAYTKDDFGLEDQRELASLFYRAARRGTNLMLSNSDTPPIRDLYRHFKIRSIKARRMINAEGRGRGVVSEVVILGYKREEYTRMLNNSARLWLVENNYPEVVQMIDEILTEWEKAGKKTRRNWWDVLAGSRTGQPVSVEGRMFPVLRCARKRKGWHPTENSLSRNRREKVPVLNQKRSQKK